MIAQPERCFADAVRSGKAERIIKWLDWGLPVDQLDSKQSTGLMIAAEMGNEPITKLLIERKAALDLDNSRNKSALFYAAKNGHRSICDC